MVTSTVNVYLKDLKLSLSPPGKQRQDQSHPWKPLVLQSPLLACFSFTTSNDPGVSESSLLLSPMVCSSVLLLFLWTEQGDPNQPDFPDKSFQSLRRTGWSVPGFPLLAIPPCGARGSHPTSSSGPALLQGQELLFPQTLL